MNNSKKLINYSILLKSISDSILNYLLKFVDCLKILSNNQQYLYLLKVNQLSSLNLH